MFINSTNTNKTNNHLSSKLNLPNKEDHAIYDVGNPGPGLGQTKCCGVMPVNGIAIICGCESSAPV